MPVETLTAPPCEFSAGTTVRFSVGYADYPATAWTLSFHLLGLAALSVNGVADGDDFTVTLPVSQTANLSPGQYNWSAKVTETATGDVAIAAKGCLTVTPDLSNSTVGPHRARYEAALASMTSISSGKNSSVEVEGQSFTRHNMKDLMQIIDRLESKAIEEDHRLGRATSGTTKTVKFYI